MTESKCSSGGHEEGGVGQGGGEQGGSRWLYGGRGEGGGATHAMVQHKTCGRGRE